MKWFKVFASEPSTPIAMHVTKHFGNEGFGALMRLWCHAATLAGYGVEPGRLVDRTSGQPLVDWEFAYVCELDEEKWRALRDLCLARGHFDKAAWEDRQEIFIPEMEARAGEWTQRVRKKKEREAQRAERASQKKRGRGHEPPNGRDADQGHSPRVN